MMSPETAKNFHDNVEWFRDFYARLENLLYIIKTQLLQSEHLKGKALYPSQYAYEASVTLPEPCFAFYPSQQEDYTSLFVGTVLRKNWLSQRLSMHDEPMLMIVAHNLHDWGAMKQASQQFQRVALRILEDSSVDNWAASEDRMSFSGSLGSGARGRIDFSGFLVPLDAFSEENCKTQKPDTVIGKAIVERVEKLLCEFDKTKQ